MHHIWFATKMNAIDQQGISHCSHVANLAHFKGVLIISRQLEQTGGNLLLFRRNQLGAHVGPRCHHLRTPHAQPFQAISKSHRHCHDMQPL
jgi:hypothetical protein